MRRLYLSCIIVILVILFIGIFTYLCRFIEPKISITAAIRPITISDYNRIKERKDESFAASKIDDFRNVSLEIKYTEPLALIKNRKITFEHLSKTIAKGGKVIELSGGYSEQDNKNELKAEYTESAEVYLNGQSVYFLKDLLDDNKIRISWDKLGTGKEERIYYLSDLIELE
ncbi:hypothetical protein ACPUYX_11835 [Desulfosporosinus sp. SYSU MS00001]|uniref:hypothetical protein n=1 Tax=Desulfosporosinus sp. SYSU MS00001 TaxID=3416284 RepID=UPI003CF30962